LLCEKELRQRTHAYLAEVLKSLQCPALIVGGVADHVHVLSQLAKTQSIANVIEHVKTSSSRWLKTQGVPSLVGSVAFGGFSVSQSHVASVVAYIENQEEHHRTMTFEDEFRLLLKRHRIAFDERYVWD
jgi:REP-associated tyrosine transposase